MAADSNGWIEIIYKIMPHLNRPSKKKCSDLKVRRVSQMHGSKKKAEICSCTSSYHFNCFDKASWEASTPCYDFY